MNQRMAVVIGVVLALGAGACGGTTPATTDPIASGTTPSSRPSAMDTLAEKPAVSVTRPSAARDIPIGDLPDEMRLENGRLGINEDEGKCVDTVVYDWVNGPDASTDETVRVAALGSAVVACVDQPRIARLIATQVRVTTPGITVAQADCVEGEIGNSDPEALAVFLGAFTYGGSGVPELQLPFITSFTTACELG